MMDLPVKSSKSEATAIVDIVKSKWHTKSLHEDEKRLQKLRVQVRQSFHKMPFLKTVVKPMVQPFKFC